MTQGKAYKIQKYFMDPDGQTSKEREVQLEALIRKDNKGSTIQKIKFTHTGWGLEALARIQL